MVPVTECNSHIITNECWVGCVVRLVPSPRGTRVRLDALPDAFAARRLWHGDSVGCYWLLGATAPVAYIGLLTVQATAQRLNAHSACGL